MTNKDYYDIGELLADLKQDVLTSVKDGEVDKSIKKVYQEKTEDIYDIYEPRYNGSRYRHGESGSFADPINFKSSVVEKSNIIEYELHNERTSDCNCAYCRNKDLKQDMLTSVKDGEVDKSIKKVYQEKTEDIYDIYEPRYNGSRYRHGESGSFADPINFKSTVVEKSNTIEYELHNERTSDCNCAYCRNKDLYLDYFIEEGIAGSSRILKRPAYQNTLDELEESEIIEKALEKDLRNKGWD